MLVFTALFFLFGGADQCGLDPIVQNSLSDHGTTLVAKIERYEPDSINKHLEEEGTIFLHVLKILRGSMKNNQFQAKYRRDTSKISRPLRSRYLPWQNVDPTPGKIVLLTLRTDESEIRAVQVVNSPTDPIIQMVEDALNLKSDETVLLDRLNSKCDFVRLRAKRELNSGQCLRSIACRERIFQREYSILESPGGARTQSKADRAWALEIILDDYLYPRFDSDTPLYHHIIAVALKHLDDSDIQIREQSARFIASNFRFSRDRLELDIKKLPLTARHISLEKLRNDIKNKVQFSEQARQTIDELAKFGIE